MMAGTAARTLPASLLLQITSAIVIPAIVAMAMVYTSDRLQDQQLHQHEKKLEEMHRQIRELERDVNALHRAGSGYTWQSGDTSLGGNNGKREQ
jgi:type II secretory pathway component PulJ